MDSTTQQIKEYINSLPEAKQPDLLMLQNTILRIMPKCKLWFFDGKDENGKIVSNPNIGFGVHTLKYANGTTKEFYKIGISANTTGISVYIMGIEDKTYLANTYGKLLGKAKVTGYCIKFKTLKDIHFDVLKTAIKEAVNTK